MGFFNFIGNLGLILGHLLGGILISNYSTNKFVIDFYLAGIIELIDLGVNIIFTIKFIRIISPYKFAKVFEHL